MSKLQSLISVILLLSSILSPTNATSRHAIKLNQSNTKTGLQVTLKRIDSGRNFTKYELFQRAMKRGKKRMQKLYTMALASSDPTIQAPVHAGDGEYLMQLSMGTPPLSYDAILDTGSDLIWTQCKPCQQCFKQPTSIFDPNKTSSFSNLPCSSNLCKAIPTSTCSSDGDNCEYLYMYGDYSSTQGVMSTETFTFGNFSVPNIAFGCGFDNEGRGFSQGSGLIGMGRGPLSLVSQLDEPKFSYCLTSIGSKKTSTLLMGSKATSTQVVDSPTTPLIKSQSSPTFYYLSLEGITVGEKLLPIEKSTFALQNDGTGGMIIDSGTTITYLEENAFELLKKEFTNQMKYPVADSNELQVCFTPPPAANVQDIKVPKIVFHFQGADLDLPGENYILMDSKGDACLAMGSSNGMSIFGNYQQQNVLVVHDLVKETISFVPTQCDQL